MIVSLDYEHLIDPTVDLKGKIKEAFGNGHECLGVLFVKNVPGLVPMRNSLLKTASKLANLPQKELDAVTHPESTYNFGWSHGKEIMNGKPDFAKGSYYNNPVYDKLDVDDDYRVKYPEYGYPNIWPSSLPNLKTEFMDLGALIVQVGKLVAKRCDEYIMDLGLDPFMEDAISKSINSKARLLHYFPMSQEQAHPVQGNMDSWCGLHIDHSMLTGLTSAMYLDESTLEEVDLNNTNVAKALEPSGLYIQTRSGEFLQAKIPSNFLAFQLGEASQLQSNGLLVATPHLVRGASYPNMARNTFAVFMQPNVDHRLTEQLNFDLFTKQVMQRHYKM